MSKEQTPITATVFEMFFKLESHFPKEVKELYLQKEQEQINAKVLEALEREFSKLDYVPVMDGEMAGINYYETEVKPNYEL